MKKFMLISLILSSATLAFAQAPQQPYTPPFNGWQPDSQMFKLCYGTDDENIKTSPGCVQFKQYWESKGKAATTKSNSNDAATEKNICSQIKWSPLSLKDGLVPSFSTKAYTIPGEDFQSISKSTLDGMKKFYSDNCPLIDQGRYAVSKFLTAGFENCLSHCKSAKVSTATRENAEAFRNLNSQCYVDCVSYKSTAQGIFDGFHMGAASTDCSGSSQNSGDRKNRVTR